MFCIQVRITPYHLRRFPTAQLLQYMQRCALLYMPARPGLPQVMPAEILDGRPLLRGIPRLGADLNTMRADLKKVVRRDSVRRRCETRHGSFARPAR